MMRSPKESSDSESTKRSQMALRSKRVRSPDVCREELKQFRKEMSAMMSDWQTQLETKIEKNLTSFKSEIQTLLVGIDVKVTDMEKAVTYLSTQYDDMNSKVVALERRCADNETYVCLLEDKIEELQRNSRNASVEIRNVPVIKMHETKEDLLDIVQSLAKAIDVKISSNEIKDIFRISGTGTSKPIITEMSSSLLRNQLIKGVKHFNKQKPSKLNASNIGIVNNNNAIYVVEHLTQKANRLHFLARELVRGGKYKYCWTSNGRIFLRKDDGKPAILIKAESQVHQLKQED